MIEELEMANVDLGQMEIDHVDKIGNTDTIALVALIDLGLQQFSRCPSATATDVHSADYSIGVGWITRFKRYFENFAGVPELYLPKAHPTPHQMPAAPIVNIVQNPALQNMMYQMVSLRTQLLHSEDAERMTSFHKEEAKVVITPWIAKFELFLELIQTNIGNPETTWLPDADLQEPGVNPGEPR